MCLVKQKLGQSTLHAHIRLQVFLNAHQVTEAQLNIDGSLSALQQQCRRLLRPPEGEATKVKNARDYCRFYPVDVIAISKRLVSTGCP